MHADIAPTESLFDASGTIISNLVCRRCGYNLRGLSRNTRCPECGAAVGLSTQGDLLRFADPGWVDQLARGTKYVYLGIIVGFFGGLLGGCSGGLAMGFVGGVHPMLVVLLTTAFGIAMGALILYGAWIATAPDPGGMVQDRYLTTRRITRLGFVGHFASRLLSPLSATFGIGSYLQGILLGLVGAALQLVSLIGFVVGLSYLAQLADRIPEPALAKRARFLRTAISIMLGLAVLFAFAAAAVSLFSGGATTLTATSQGFQVTTITPPPASSATTPATRSGPGGVATGPNPATGPGVPVSGSPPGPQFGAMTAVGIFGACVWGTAMVFFGIMAIITLRAISHRLAEQAKYARQTWAASEPGAVTLPPLPPNNPT